MLIELANWLRRLFRTTGDARCGTVPVCQTDPAECNTTSACETDTAALERWSNELRSKKSDSCQVEAARRLGSIGDPAAVEVLQNALMCHDKDVVCEACATALGEIGDPTSVELLYEKIRGQGPPSYQCEGEVMIDTSGECYFRALGKIGSNRAIELLCSLLKYTRPQVRQAAIAGLSCAAERSADATAALVEALDDEEVNVQCRAAMAIGGNCLGFSAQHRSLPGPLPSFLADALCKAIKHPNVNVRYDALYNFCDARFARSIPFEHRDRTKVARALCDALDPEQDYELNSAIVSALAAVRDPLMNKTLLGILKNQSYGAVVHLAAAWALVWSGDREAAGAIRSAQGRANEWLSGQLGEALEELSKHKNA